MKARRHRPRLLPVVIAASAGLLVLKTLGLALQGGYVLVKPTEHAGFARALTGVPAQPAVDLEPTGATPAKKDAKPKDAAKPEGEGAKPAEPPVQPLPPVVSAAEKRVLETLVERRKQLEERAREMDLREQLLRSAEQKIEERLGTLKAEEPAAAEAEKAKAKTENPFASLVTIYEAMKPREAAKVFDRMDARALAPLASRMNPRKFSEVLAQMSPESAEKLTKALMLGTPAPPPAPAARPEPLPEPPRQAAPRELPRLDSKAAQ